MLAFLKPARGYLYLLYKTQDLVPVFALNY